MRIDKYLWSIRYYKTRSLAAEACKKNQVHINGQLCKASREVFGGEKVKVRKNQVDLELLVLDTPSSRVGAKLVDVYRKDITPPEVLERMAQIRLAQSLDNRWGEGRPTKKDRRDIEDYTWDWLEEADDDETHASETAF